MIRFEIEAVQKDCLVGSTQFKIFGNSSMFDLLAIQQWLLRNKLLNRFGE